MIWSTCDLIFYNAVPPQESGSAFPTHGIAFQRARDNYDILVERANLYISSSIHWTAFVKLLTERSSMRLCRPLLSVPTRV